MSSELFKLSVFQLAELAGCAAPDTVDSAGANFLHSVRCEVAEALDAGRLGPDASEDPGDVAVEIANEAPSVYNHTRWQEFVDLAAYQEEPETGAWPESLTDAAGVALYQIARRLVAALVDGK